MLGLLVREALRTFRYALAPPVSKRTLISSSMLLQHLGNELHYPSIQRFTAKGPNGDHVISVMLPQARPPKGGYPVLTVLDGNAYTGAWADAITLQGPFARHCRMDPSVVVTIGYRGSRPIDMGRRAFDFLPPHSSPRWRDRFMQGAPWHQPGGAEAFLEFLIGDLRDDLSRRLPVNPERHCLCGHSFGGLFALRAFLIRPRSFRKYVALSPSIWWDDRRLFKELEANLPLLPNDLHAAVLIAVGADETPGRPRISKFMILDALKVARTLSRTKRSGLSVDCRVLQHETHQSVPFTMLSSILRFAATESQS